MSTPDLASWRLVVPVKGQLAAKSRLHPPAGVRRADLAHAIALDTLAAVCSSMAPSHLVVVTSDELTAGFARTQGAAVVRDPGDGLNGALRKGAGQARARWGACPVGILLGDLPALRPPDLRAALLACGEHPRAFVPDAEGTGTVLLTALDGEAIDPAFGPGSAAAHARQSARLDLDLPNLRSDVDDDAGLGRAVALGVGPRTRAALDGSRLA